MTNTESILRAVARSVLFADLGTPLPFYVLDAIEDEAAVPLCLVELARIPHAFGGREDDSVCELLSWRASAPYVALLPRLKLDPGDGSDPVVAVPSASLFRLAADIVEAYESGTLPPALHRYAAGAERALDALARMSTDTRAVDRRQPTN
jgi:hypothetical protein